ncbi:MAG: DNA polymerase III subunit beta [Waddliaceae bacterium]
MKFIIATQELHYILNKCQSIVAQRVTMPILSNFLIEAKRGELAVTATDLTLAIRCSTEAKILEEGETALSARQFVSLIRELTAVNVEISTDPQAVTAIIADSSRFKLHGMSPREFPSLPDLAGSTSIKVSQEQLKDMFFRTSFAVSDDEERIELTGVFLHVENGNASFVGTDGKCLARTSIPIELEASFSGNYIIPLKAVEEIRKNLTDEGEATLHLMSDKIAVETEHTLIISKLLFGDYPDVTQVIPNNTDETLTLHREELITILRQISLFAPDSDHSVKFSFSDGEVKLTANTMEIGEGKVSMPVNYHGPQLDIAFNPVYFLDILKHTRGETVKIGLIDAYNPGVITDSEEGEALTKKSPLFVLMPMRLNRE